MNYLILLAALLAAPAFAQEAHDEVPEPAPVAAAAPLILDPNPLRPDVIGIHLRSVHAERNGGPNGWNNDTMGVYLRWNNGVTLGYMARNSLEKSCFYAGYTVQTADERWALTAGVFLPGCYDKLVADNVPAGTPGAVLRCNPGCRWVTVRDTWAPLFSPSVRFRTPITGPLVWRVNYAPKLSRDGEHAFLLSTEFY